MDGSHIWALLPDAREMDEDLIYWVWVDLVLAVEYLWTENQGMDNLSSHLPVTLLFK